MSPKIANFMQARTKQFKSLRTTSHTHFYFFKLFTSLHTFNTHTSYSFKLINNLATSVSRGATQTENTTKLSLHSNTSTTRGVIVFYNKLFLMRCTMPSCYLVYCCLQQRILFPSVCETDMQSLSVIKELHKFRSVRWYKINTCTMREGGTISICWDREDAASIICVKWQFCLLILYGWNALLNVNSKLCRLLSWDRYTTGTAGLSVLFTKRLHEWFEPFYWLMQQRSLVLDKLTLARLDKYFLFFHGIWRFVTVYTTARHRLQSWHSWIQFPSPHTVSLRSILILFPYLRLVIPSGFFTLRLQL